MKGKEKKLKSKREAQEMSFYSLINQTMDKNHWLSRRTAILSFCLVTCIQVKQCVKSKCVLKTFFNSLLFKTEHPSVAMDFRISSLP